MNRATRVTDFSLTKESKEFQRKIADIERSIVKNTEHGDNIVKTMLDNVVMGISMISPKMEIIWLNNTLRKWFPKIDVRKRPFCYKSFYSPPREKICHYCPTIKAFKTGKIQSTEVDVCADGKIYNVIATPVGGDYGKINYVVETVEDITERKKTVEELRKFKTISDRAGYGVVISSLKGDLLYVNEAFAKMHGYSSEELIGKNLFVFHSEEQMKQVHRLNERLKKEGSYTSEEVWHKRKDGAVFPTLMNATVIKDEEGIALFLSATALDITELKKDEELIRRSEEEFRLTFENAKDAIFWADPKTGVIVKCNKAAEALLERKKDEIIGHHHTIIHPPQNAKCYTKMFKKHLKNKGMVDDEAEVITKSGKIKPVHITASLTQVMGKPILQGIFRDITLRKQMQGELEKLNKQLVKSNEKLKHLVLKDPSTDLYNHRYLGEAIEAEFYRARRYAHSLSVIMLDLDYFKSINDIYGYQFGDLVLRQLARLLKSLVRRYDIVIRYGGEEFIIVSPGTNRALALNLSQRLLETINLYNFGNKKHTVKLKLSISVASYPEDKTNKGIDLVKITEHILSKAKEYGGNRVLSSLDMKAERPVITEESEEKSDVKFLKERIDKVTRRANQNLIEAIFAFAKTLEVKDHYTGEHAERTVQYATEIAQEIGLTKDEIECIRQAAILHDLGKVGISENILRKKSKLTKKEFEEIKKHPQIAVDILRPIHFLHPILPPILYHHARWDGKGYPDRLKGEEIPIGARIVAIADVYQALISDRPYRKAFSKIEAIQIIKQGSGTQFDPNIVNVFIRVVQ